MLSLNEMPIHGVQDVHREAYNMLQHAPTSSQPAEIHDISIHWTLDKIKRITLLQCEIRYVTHNQCQNILTRGDQQAQNDFVMQLLLTL
jgi:hypothetical protein